MKILLREKDSKLFPCVRQMRLLASFAGKLQATFIFKTYKFIKNMQTNLEVINMPKDSQPDQKEARIKKANNQTPITKEDQNHNPNNKKKH